MKEILEQTGLTDRAVRLYIANGLVNPADEKSYDGRSKIDFSAEDAERLKKIALLRKADFSIAQIKSIISGGEEAKIALNEYIAEKSETQENIAAALNALDGVEDASIDVICERLENGFEDKGLPEEDMKPSKGEKRETLLFKILCGLLMLPTAAIAICSFVGCLKDYRFYTLEPSWEGVLTAIFALIPTIILMIISGLYSKQRFDEKKRKHRRVFSTVMLIAVLISMVFFLPLQLITFGFAPNTSSFTENPKDYLELDDYVKGWADSIYGLFPAKMPDEARNVPYTNGEIPETTKYRYFYQCCIDPRFDIFAEWQLSDKAYEAAKAENIAKGAETVQKGEWVCVFLNENGAEPSYGECIELFAYNDSTNTVRYAFCYSTDYALDEPYYLDLDWN